MLQGTGDAVALLRWPAGCLGCATRQYEHAALQRRTVRCAGTRSGSLAGTTHYFKFSRADCWQMEDGKIPKKNLEAEVQQFDCPSGVVRIIRRLSWLACGAWGRRLGPASSQAFQVTHSLLAALCVSLGREQRALEILTLWLVVTWVFHCSCLACDVSAELARGVTR